MNLKKRRGGMTGYKMAWREEMWDKKCNYILIKNKIFLKYLLKTFYYYLFLLCIYVFFYMLVCVCVCRCLRGTEEGIK